MASHSKPPLKQRVKQPQGKLRVLSLHLLKESVTSPDDALKDDLRGALNKYIVPDTLLPSATLYTPRPSAPTPPQWASFLAPIPDPNLRSLRVQGASALLISQHSDRLFAFYFGHGNLWLRDDSYERRFGLKVALNSVEPTKLKSVDTHTYDSMLLSSRVQADRDTEMASFGLDVSRDLLRKVVGTPADQTGIFRFAGSDSLSVWTRASFFEIAKLCNSLLKVASKRTYQKHFAWVDHLEFIKEKSVLETLNNKLVDHLGRQILENMLLTVPTLSGGDDTNSFRFSGLNSNETFHDLSIERYLASLAKTASELSIGTLKRHQLVALDSSGRREVDSWSIYRCIVWETNLHGSIYALVDGEWFKIQQDFVREVHTYLSGIPTGTLRLPNFEPGYDEGAYNIKVGEVDRRLLCMDRVLVSNGLPRTSLEACDLISTDRQFVHVKRGMKSSTISHLFEQGENSALAFLSNDIFRANLKNEIQKLQREDIAQTIPTEPPAANDFEIVYAITTTNGNKWPYSLPFFSKLSFMQHAKRLHAIRFRVALVPILEV